MVIIFLHNKRYIPIAIWWSLTLGWLPLCLFLSWQTGEGTGRLSLTIVRFLLKLLAMIGITPEEAAFHMLLRKCAHFGVFFIAGILFCGATETLWELRPVRGWTRLLCGMAVTLLALLADVPKIWIPGRHLQWSESCLNAAGALAGFLVLYMFTKCAHRGKERPD